MPSPNTNTLLVSMVRLDGQDQGEDILSRLDTMIDLLVKIRNDQRSVQQSDGGKQKIRVLELGLGL